MRLLTAAAGAAGITHLLLHHPQLWPIAAAALVFLGAPLLLAWWLGGLTQISEGAGKR